MQENLRAKRWVGQRVQFDFPDGSDFCLDWEQIINSVVTLVVRNSSANDLTVEHYQHRCLHRESM